MLSSVMAPYLIRCHARIAARHKVGVCDGGIAGIDLAHGLDCDGESIGLARYQCDRPAWFSRLANVVEEESHGNDKYGFLVVDTFWKGRAYIVADDVRGWTV